MDPSRPTAQGDEIREAELEQLAAALWQEFADEGPWEYFDEQGRTIESEALDRDLNVIDGSERQVAGTRPVSWEGLTTEAESARMRFLALARETLGD